MSNMLKEALASAETVAAQLRDTSRVEALAAKLGQQPRHVALTVARGSSDHAASYFASLTMSRLGVPVASLPMSVATLQQAPLQVRDQLALAFSQSGKSPDLVGTMEALRKAGALTVAAVNAPNSPLADACEFHLPLVAGPELSVAATKSYIAMLSISAQLVAHWQKDDALLGALNTLPDALQAAGKLDWSKAVDELRGVERMIVIGRGLGLAIAQEAALKLKETSGIQAEAFSSAEVRHGPMELIDRDYPLLVFAPRGPEQAGLLQLARDMQARGARVLLAAPADVPEATLPLATTAHAALDPIAAILSFYVMAAGLAAARGRNPDAPRHLNKVTETH
ncbi:Glutamine--fructose-6-phosphate aminotransferase [isomerizing] [Paraburkholderia aspalathi]|uniref:Glutamine--fructose-6-phosphate aminotransferase [isomerizing] n=3 Tax=Burkholderiaceae TaxID=119060 RepID=A0ABM8S149_9BURK|nr:Glutamine--fructose-6-phosphate aminotransferase [isomerizing] [Paraburkholderia nemoris]CAE6741036.1 Glutamine--fructose-6-phosphate aminotransferase [isomerizing] [Paraburkholderia nemoris]CAE6764720.1 Glutamine--fructose-6-phosphate aminotransferase [isomerizing] [Paraburkholderia nemoris]CAE6782961.1 Glutamine--fructose-6-phosphate aminotransferase [isomerizing] [Paraburkholderia aspalathi]CAE6930732.1 Glutamine--fructose-6-phosphate aminotransferase [isomerizing] [Paraburkholderia nemor